MTKKNTPEIIEERYKEQGGYTLLKSLIESGASQGLIMQVFGVSRWTVTKWLKELFDEVDPRMVRRQKKIENMVEFARTHSLFEFKEKYKFHNVYYYQEALKIIYKEKIYVSKN